MKKELRVLSLFSGVGAFEKGLDKSGIDYQLVNYCENEPHASSCYAAIHGESEDKNLEDVTKIKIDELEDFDLLLSGSPCFREGTLITTDEGYKNIEDIKRGDMVLTHQNRYREVLTPMTNHANDIYELKIKGANRTYVTAEHPYYVKEMTRKWNNAKGVTERVLGETIWKEVKDLKIGDFIGFNINKKKENPRNLTSEECWLMGRYVADGHLTNTKRKGRKNSYIYQVVFSIGSDKLDVFKDNVRNIHFSCYPHSKSTHRCVVSSKYYLDLIRDIGLGEGAINKKIPIEILNLPKSLLERFLDGYMSGDGCFSNGEYKANSISKELIYGIGDIVSKIYNNACSIHFFKRPKTCTIEGRTVNQHDTWSISFNKERKIQADAIVQDGFVWQPFRKKELLQGVDEIVYNFEVEEDNSYVANNCIVHNCQSVSRNGSESGAEKGSDTRSSLMWEQVEIAKIKKPKYIIWENVKNMISKKHIHNVEEYIEELNKIGYRTTYEVLNSRYYNIPQNRERVFAVSVLSGDRFDFPEKVELTKTLREMSCFREKDDITDNFVRYYKENVDQEKDFFDFFDDLRIGRTGVKNMGMYAYDQLNRVTMVDYKSDVLSPTLSCRGVQNYCIKFYSKGRIYKPSPRMCFRLMGFSHSDFDKIKDIGTDSQLWDRAGNSIVVDVASAIFDKLLK